MSQYQPNAAPGRSFIEKINLKFSNLTLSASTTFNERDGSSDDDTLIHNAFVKFFDSRGEPYPEWLGVKPSKLSSGHQQPRGSGTYSSYSSNSTSNHSSLQFQPVRASYNTQASQLSHSRQNLNPETVPADRQSLVESEDRPSYTRRSNSRLQEMYQKSRQQAPSGHSPSLSLLASSTPSLAARTNLAGQRLRERMMNGSPPQNGTPRSDPGYRPTWGKQ